jgi:protein SCO1/2
MSPAVRPWLWAGGAALILAVPTVAVVRYHPSPPLPELGRVPSFALTDQAGQPFSARDLDGKVWVADFIFTSCAEVCPRLTAQMAALQQLPELRLVSFTVDPERDTVERLRGYATGFHADRARWKFLTGPAQQIEDAVVRGFKMGISREKDDHASDGFAILHGTRLVLVDGRGAIRGY